MIDKGNAALQSARAVGGVMYFVAVGLKFNQKKKYTKISLFKEDLASERRVFGMLVFLNIYV